MATPATHLSPSPIPCGHPQPDMPVAVHATSPFPTTLHLRTKAAFPALAHALTPTAPLTCARALFKHLFAISGTLGRVGFGQAWKWACGFLTEHLDRRLGLVGWDMCVCGFRRQTPASWHAWRLSSFCTLLSQKFCACVFCLPSFMPASLPCSFHLLSPHPMPTPSSVPHSFSLHHLPPTHAPTHTPPHTSHHSILFCTCICTPPFLPHHPFFFPTTLPHFHFGGGDRLPNHHLPPAPFPLYSHRADLA